MEKLTLKNIKRAIKHRYRSFCKYFWKKRYADFLYADTFGKRINWSNPHVMNHVIRKIYRRFKHLIESPMYMLGKLYCKYLPIDRVPDSLYLRVQFHNTFGYPLNLINPKTFNEKLQWLKLHDRNPMYTEMVDKYAVKSYVSDLIGPQYVVPLLGIWERFEDIDWDKLPDSFVLKTTHDSGGVVICRDKNSFDREAAEIKLCASLAQNFYQPFREWAYKNVSRRIIAEKYMQDDGLIIKDLLITSSIVLMENLNSSMLVKDSKIMKQHE